MPFTNERRTTLDGYEFQEHVAGCGWQYSHTDIGYNVMLENKRAYQDNQALGGNPFRIVKRRIQKSEHSTEAINRMEAADLKAKIERLQRRIVAKPDSKRNKSRQFWIEHAQRRLTVIN